MDDIITIEECITRLDAIRHETVPDNRDHFALSAGIAALYEMENGAPAVNRWIPCSERLPYIGVDVIVYVRTWREHKVQFGYRYSEGTWSVANIGVPNDEITFWMPLPERPESEAQSDDSE